MENIMKDNLKMILYMAKDNFINLMAKLLRGCGVKAFLLGNLIFFGIFFSFSILLIIIKIMGVLDKVETI